jgi:hypothetical protein
VRPVLALFLYCALAAACVGVRSTPETRYQGIMLNARTLGADELRAVMERAPEMRAYIERNGPPDYLLVAGPNDVELVYYRDSRLVHFHRDPDDGQTTWKAVSPLPTPLVNVLEVDLRAGTPGPFDPNAPMTNCWSVELAEGRCRTCCLGSLSCSISCG